MRTKKFLIQLQFDDRTRWLYPDTFLTALLQRLAISSVMSHTEGAVPAITCIQEEQPEQAKGGTNAG